MWRFISVLLLTFLLWRVPPQFLFGSQHPENLQEQQQTRQKLLSDISGYAKKKDFPALSEAQQRLAQLCKSRMRYTEALGYYLEALDNDLRGGNHGAGAIYLEISDLFRINNRQRLAAKHLQHAMKHALESLDPRLLAQALNAAGRLAYGLGELEHADACATASLWIESFLREYVCAMESCYLKALILEGSPHQNGTDPEPDAENRRLVLLQEAVDIGLTAKRYDNLLPVLFAYLQIVMKRGELASAARYLDEINDIYAPYYPYYFFYTCLRGLLNEKMGRMAEARRFYTLTAEALDIHFRDFGGQRPAAFQEQIESIYRHMTEFYLSRHALEGRKADLHEALFLSEVKNGYAHRLIPRSVPHLPQLAAEQRKLEREIALRREQLSLAIPGAIRNFGKIGATTPGSELKKAINALEQQKNELMEYLLEMPFEVKRSTRNGLRIDEIRNRLLPEQMFLKYTLLADRSYVFHLSRSGYGFRPLSAAPAHLARLVRALADPLDDFTRGAVDYLHIHFDLDAARQLYDILLKDILAENPGVRELFIIPDRELFRIPFEALVSGFEGSGTSPGVIFSEYRAARFVIRDYTVSYYLSLYHALARPRQQWAPEYNFIAFGAPEIKPAHENGIFPVYAPLPSSRTEIEAIAQLSPGKSGKIFYGADFNRGNFSAWAPRGRIIHVATHFLANLDFPHYSALLFSGSSEGRGRPYDLYHACELSALSLNAELATLSACETSEAHLLGFQGMRGMMASFRQAGVQSLLVSMWPVDQYSSLAMPLFYKNLFRGRPSGDALREAKLEFMASVAPFRDDVSLSCAHPFLWANYILCRFSAPPPPAPARPE